MQAYPKSLEGSDTTLILTPDSDFFRYLKDPGGSDRPVKDRPADKPAQ